MSDLVNATKVIENDYISYIKMLKQLWRAIEVDLFYQEYILKKIYTEDEINKLLARYIMI